jgi:hypothetical protein
MYSFTSIVRFTSKYVVIVLFYINFRGIKYGYDYEKGIGLIELRMS